MVPDPSGIPVNFTATRVLYRTLSWRSTDVNDSTGVAWLSSPASRGRMFGMACTSSAAAAVAAS